MHWKEEEAKFLHSKNKVGTTYLFLYSQCLIVIEFSLIDILRKSGFLEVSSSSAGALNWKEFFQEG